MFLTDTLPEQPYFAYVEFRVGNEDLLYSLEDATKCLLSFKYIKKSPTEANEWEIQLFDERWDYLESLIAANYQRIMFRYGYYDPTGNNLSPYHTGIVTNIVPQIVIDGTIVTVAGTSNTYMMSKKQNHETRYRTWGGKNIVISDIIKEICENNGWQLKEYVETEPVYEIDDPFLSYPTEKIFYQSGMNDLAFIKNVLVPMAVTKEDLIGGYRFWFDDAEQAKVGHPVCYFKPFEDWNKGTAKTYFYMRHHQGYGEVLSWQPDLSQRWVLLRQGYNSAVSGIEIYRKMSTTPRAILEAPAKILGSGESQAYTQQIVTGRVTMAGDFNSRVALNQLSKEIYAFTSQDNTNPHCYKATIEVIGDPQRKVDENILVVCTTSDNRLHYSSGLYKIWKIEDTIDSSGYKSSFELFRNMDVTRTLENDKFDKEAGKRE